MSSEKSLLRILNSPVQRIITFFVMKMRKISFAYILNVLLAYYSNTILKVNDPNLFHKLFNKKTTYLIKDWLKVGNGSTTWLREHTKERNKQLFGSVAFANASNLETIPGLLLLHV